MISLRVLLKHILLVTVFLVERGICEYVVGFNEGFEYCSDYDNEVFKADNMDLAKTCEDGEDTMYMSGYFEVVKTLEEDIMIDIEVSKQTEMGSEPVWSCSVGLCKSLEDEDAPWAAAMKEMNVTTCPVATGEYPCKKFALKMDFMKDLLNPDWEGSYTMTLKMTENMDVISCHNLGVVIADIDERK